MINDVNVELLSPPSTVVYVLAPLLTLFIFAVIVSLTFDPVPLWLLVKKLVTVAVSIVPDVYLLTVVDSQLTPADCVANDDVLSVNEAHRCGLVPCAESLMVKDLELNVDGADGTAFIVNATVSSSSWKKVSGVPDALILHVMPPADVPE